MMAPSSVPAMTAEMQVRGSKGPIEPCTLSPPANWCMRSSLRSYKAHALLSQGYSAALHGFSAPGSVGEHLPMDSAWGWAHLPRPFIAFRSTCASPSSLKLPTGCTVPRSCGDTECVDLPIGSRVGGRKDGGRDSATQQAQAKAGGGLVRAPGAG